MLEYALYKAYRALFTFLTVKLGIFDHENGQKDILSPYRILVNSLNKEKHEFSDLFYNNLDIPDLWCVFPQELDGQILCRGKKKADIFFKSPGSLTLTHGLNSQKSFRYGFFYVKFLFLYVVCVVYL